MKVIHFIGINRYFRLAGFLSAFLLVTLCGLTFLPVSFQDEHAEAATGTAAESTITLDVVNSVASVDLTVNSSSGTFATSASNDEASFSVVTNNYTGYTLSISADDNTGELVNGEECLSSIESAISASTFDSSTYNGLWGYKPSKLNSTSNTNYLPSPTTEATTLDVTNSANNEANTYTIALGARADYTKPSGTYSKTFILTAVANKINYSVTYNKNTTDTVTNMPYSNTGNVQSGDTNSTSITLSDLVPVHDGYNFKGWCSVATSDDTCSGTTYNPDGAGTNLTYGIDQTTLNIGTLYAMWESAETKCDSTKLCVQYEGNGLTYGGSKTVNRVNYNSNTTLTPMTKYSHTSNISDAGVQSGNFTTPSNTNEVITIPSAESLNISFTYQTSVNSVTPSFSGAAVSSFWEGNHPNYSVSSNYSSGVKCGGNTTGYYGGGSSPSTIECTVSGDFVTFGFYSAKGLFGAPTGYGYYAVITGTSVINTRTVASGEYATPTGTNAIFRGWSSTQTTAGAGLPSNVEYADEDDVMDNIPGDNGDVATVYAVWQQGYSITFNKDSNVSSIAVLDSDGNTVGTITSSGQSLILVGGYTYTIKPTHATGYATNTISKTSGAGTLNGKEFTVGAGGATINITSRYVTPMQNWNGCSSLAQSSTIELLDTRDNEVYLIGKLKDGKCWMVENLNLAGGTALSASDTNVDSNYISSFTTSNGLTKTGDTIVLPASSTSGFSLSNYSYVYNSGNKTNCGASGQNTPCYSYYSWEAATLGSGRTISTDNTDAPYSICPKGWRLPTAYSTSATNWQTTSDYYVLAHQYGLDSTTSTDESDDGFYTQAGPGTVPNFLSAGYYGSSLNGGGSIGYYWSATSSTGGARVLYFNPSYMSSAGSNTRNYGASVRCLLAE